MMRWILLVALATSVSGQSFFTRFMVNRISFTNAPCKTESNMDGTCFTQEECEDNGGHSNGTCAEGYGVCCQFLRTCGDATCFQNTYFVNPGYPDSFSDSDMCSFKIFPLKNKKVDQILITFEVMELAGPTNGDCQNDSFIITGMNLGMNAPLLCGNNTGQHLHLDVDQVSGPLRLTVKTSDSAFQRKWKIKIQQISKKDDCYAPKKCLQYYKETSGTVRSFNLNYEGEGQLLNRNKYAVCFKTLPGFCDISFLEKSFDMSITGRSGQSCDDNYIAIMGNKYCGQSLKDGQIKVDAAGPITMYVNTGELNIQESRGLALDYMQLPCLV